MIYLFLLFILLAFGISWVLSTLEGNYFVKAIFITLLLYLTLSIFYSFKNIGGWPTQSELPDRFVLKSFIIQEPNKAEQSSGYIYVWAVPQLNNKECPSGIICIKRARDNEPRAYIIEYDINMHKSMAQVEEKIKNGDIIIVEKNKKGKNDNGSDDYQFYELPNFLDKIIKE